MIDIIIPLLKGGSRFEDIELLYCLRSIEKHLSGYRNIIIVGHLPEFVNQKAVIHIPFKDETKKQSNIRNKIMAAFSHKDVSKSILFFNDDYTVLKDIDSCQIKNWYSGDLINASEKNARIAERELRAFGKPTRHFDIHVPIIYDRDLFIDAMKNYSKETSIKSIYANHHELDGEEINDLKINSNITYHRIVEETKNRHFVSWGDYGINRNYFMFMKERFPDKSRYE